MLVKYHVLLGLIFSFLVLAIFPFIGFLAFILIFLSSFLIDFDHYIKYLIDKKDFSLKRANKWFIERGNKFDSLPKEKKRKYHLGIFPFHSIEFILIFSIFSFLDSFFFFILIGFLFHITCDMLYEILTERRAIYKISLIYTLTKKELPEPKKRRAFLGPENPKGFSRNF